MLADFEEREVKLEYETYSECPPKQSIQTCLSNNTVAYRAEMAYPIEGREHLLNKAEPKRDGVIDQCLNAYCDDPAVSFKVAREPGPIEDQHCLCSKQDSDYSLGKRHHRDRESRRAVDCSIAKPAIHQVLPT
jgi:hypothetical protein